MQTLANTIVIQTTPLHDQRISLIDQEDFSSVQRKVKEQKAREGFVVDDAYLAEGILALKQYYAVALLDPKNKHAVSATIDPFWHAHILHTREYAHFCDAVFGQFIHHEPLDESIKEKVDEVRRLYQHTSKVYRKMFGYINPDFYPEWLSKNDDKFLVCLHQHIIVPTIREAALFPQVDMLVYG